MEEMTYCLRINKSLKNKLEEEATKLNISLNSYINLILDGKIKRKG